MKCPKCGSDMEARNIDKIEIDLCTSCAGIYLDDGEFESFTGVDPTTGLLRLSKFVKVLSRLNERAIRDELTGAFNRKYFNEFLAGIFDNKKRGPVTLLAIDIDFFKQFNTKFGHDGGDAVLKELSRLLHLFLRTSRDDHIFRLGGEEFCIILFDLSPEDSYYTAESLRRLIGAHPFRMPGDESVHINLSIGVTLARANDTPESFYKRSDELLYQAKNTGRNQVIMDRA